jgi:hypothetical protein
MLHTSCTWLVAIVAASAVIIANAVIITSAFVGVVVTSASTRVIVVGDVIIVITIWAFAQRVPKR